MLMQAIKFGAPTHHIRDIGQFTVSSGAIRFSDPCYANDTWCKGSMPAANGVYQAQIGLFRDSCDERSVLERIDQFKFYKDFHIKYGEGDYRHSFESIVSKARNHSNWGGHFQKIDKLLELIAEVEDVEKRTAFEEMAQFAIDWFSPRYKTKEHHYWDKELWLLFELNSALHCDTDVTRFSRSAWRFLQKIRDAQDNEGYSKEERDAVIKQLEGYLAEERIDEVTALDNKIKELQDSYDAGKPYRTHFLRIKHESVPTFEPLEQGEWLYNNEFDVGVDSGQAGFFDEGWFTKYGNERDDNNRSEEWEKTYDMLCCLSSGGNSYRNADKPAKEEGGTFEFGANSYTAHGDGSAPLFYRLNDSNEVIEAVYAYDVDEDEKEEEE